MVVELLLEPPAVVPGSREAGLHLDEPAVDLGEPAIDIGPDFGEPGDRYRS